MLTKPPHVRKHSYLQSNESEMNEQSIDLNSRVYAYATGGQESSVGIEFYCKNTTIEQQNFDNEEEIKRDFYQRIQTLQNVRETKSGEDLNSDSRLVGQQSLHRLSTQRKGVAEFISVVSIGTNEKALQAQSSNPYSFSKD